MKKLGTPDSDPPKVEGSGGVSAEGETACACERASALASPAAPRFPGGFAFAAPPCPRATTVGCCGRCARTSGAGAVVVSVVVVVGAADVGVVVDAGALVAGGGVLVLVGDGPGVGGAGTVVTSDAGVGVCDEVLVAGPVTTASADAALAGIKATMIIARDKSTRSSAGAHGGTGKMAVGGRRIIAVNCRAGS
jgi:hypothetical protein